MISLWIDKEICYDGSQLKSHWAYEQTGILGDVIVSFAGGADVPLKNMVDLVDVRNKESIFSRSMLHFIVEHFDGDLALTVARQRLLSAIAAEELRRFVPAAMIERRGDDLYEEGRKLSVSIATISPVSSLIHFAINIISDGTPVPTKGLRDHGIEPKEFADAVMLRYVDEISSMGIARCKVRPVG